MTESVKRVNVTLPVAHAERIKRLVSEHPDVYPTVSAFVSEAIAARLNDEEAHQMLLGVLHDLAGDLTEEDHAWAAGALELADRVAREHSSSAVSAA